MNDHTYKITAQDNILFVDASGPFDFDTMLQYKSETLEAIEKLKHEPWGCIACFHGSGVSGRHEATGRECAYDPTHRLSLSGRP